MADEANGENTWVTGTGAATGVGEPSCITGKRKVEEEKNVGERMRTIQKKNKRLRVGG